MFDHLDWWQIILLLAPIMLIMTAVRRTEKRRGSTLYPALTQAQKTFVLLQLLPPSLAARFLIGLEVQELETYLQAGSKIEGTGLLVHESVMKEYYRNLESKIHDSEGPLQERLAYAALSAPQEALRHLESIWPRPVSPVSSSPSVLTQS